MKKKGRKELEIEYREKYNDIPIGFEDRLAYMYEKYNVSESKANEIIQKKTDMIKSLYYEDLLVVLYEEPEGTPRPRFRLINRTNFANEAINNGSFVHVYSINAKSDSMYMKKLVNEELVQLNRLIYTPCVVEYNMYLKTPKVFSVTDKFLSEIGLIRPIKKPDFDNLEKKYSDMYNDNVWLDDTLVISGIVNKYYSILPRVEIHLKYLNQLYNKYQYNSISKRMNDKSINYYDFRRN